MTVIQQTVFEVLEAGEYPAVVSKVEPTTGQYGDQLRWQFHLENGATLSAWTSQVFSPRSKLYAWVRACFGGREIPVGWALDTAKLPGRPVRLIIVTEQGRDGEFSKVRELLPPRKFPASAPAVAPAALAKPATPPPYLEPSPFEQPDWLDDDSGDVPF